MRYLWQPPWRRAPLRATRSVSLFGGLMIATFVLGLAGGSRPMLAASAAAETLRGDLEDGCLYEVGLQVGRQVSIARPPSGSDPLSIAGPSVERASESLDFAVQHLPGVAPAVVTIEGFEAKVSGTGSGREGVDRSGVVQLVSRTDAVDHVEVVEGQSGDGILVPDVVATQIGARPGDEVELNFPGGVVQMPVAAVFRDLRAGRDKHWCSMRHLFESPSGNNPPPPVVLFEQDDLVGLLERAGVFGAYATWEYAPTGEDWYLPLARRTIAAFDVVVDRSNNPSTSLGKTIGPGDSSADSVGTVRQAERATASVESMAGPVGLGAMAVAVVMLLAAARSWLQRRAQEVTLLALRGAGPGALATKAALELAPPMLLGAAIGLVGALEVVRTVGPGPRIGPDAVVDGIVLVAMAVVVALMAAGLVVAGGVHRVGVAIGRSAVTASRRWWWELLVLAVAGATFYELRTRKSPLIDETRVDALLLLFPLLVIVGGAGLAARLLLAAKPLSWLATRLPTPAWLAARRLSAARVRVALIVTGAALAIGIVSFAGTLSSSLQATVYAKQVLGVGAPQAVRLTDPIDRPDQPSLQGISTLVTRTSEAGVVRRGHSNADILGVEPDSFADGAFWEPSFSDRSLDDLMAMLADDTSRRVPVVAVGSGLPQRFELRLLSQELGQEVGVDVEVVARPEAFPGYQFQRERPLLVINREVLIDVGVSEHAEVWIGSTASRPVDDLAAAGAPILFTMRPTQDEEGLSFVQGQQWATDYLEIVGLAAGLVTVAALGLHFAANATRRQIGAALARQLGLTRWRGWLATGLEVGTILFAGFASGTLLAWLAVHLVFRELDPLPNTPPAAIMRLDVATIVICGLGALLTTIVATAFTERRAANAALPDLLRRARD